MPLVPIFECRHSMGNNSHIKIATISNPINTFSFFLLLIKTANSCSSMASFQNCKHWLDVKGGSCMATFARSVFLSDLICKNCKRWQFNGHFYQSCELWMQTVIWKIFDLEDNLKNKLNWKGWQYHKWWWPQKWWQPQTWRQLKNEKVPKKLRHPKNEDDH